MNYRFIQNFNRLLVNSCFAHNFENWDWFFSFHYKVPQKILRRLKLFEYFVKYL